MKEFILNNINSIMRYHDMLGEDTPIIFIHGLGCASSFDYPQVASSKHLMQHRRILVDLLGSGFSDKPDNFNYSIDGHADYLEDFINYLGIKSFFIYGHSMGGAISLSLAARCKKRIKGIILSEANLDSGGGFFSKKIASYREQEYLNSGHIKTINMSKEEGNENWAASLSLSSPVAVYRESKSLIQGTMPSWRNIFYSLNTSKTFIFGEKSLPDSELEVLKNENIHIEIVKDAGHSIAWENPEGLSLAIRKGVNLNKNL